MFEAVAVDADAPGFVVLRPAGVTRARDALGCRFSPRGGGGVLCVVLFAMPLVWRYGVRRARMRWVMARVQGMSNWDADAVGLGGRVSRARGGIIVA